jgi:DNA-binding NarL/FixJ family response regulator
MAKRFKLLTPMQWRVLDLLRQGKFNRQIAYEIGVAESTVKAHVTAILHKLHLSSRLQAVIEATRLGSNACAAGFRSGSEF